MPQEYLSGCAARAASRTPLRGETIDEGPPRPGGRRRVSGQRHPARDRQVVRGLARPHRLDFETQVDAVDDEIEGFRRLRDARHFQAKATVADVERGGRTAVHPDTE